MKANENAIANNARTAGINLDGFQPSLARTAGVNLDGFQPSLAKLISAA